MIVLGISLLLGGEPPTPVAKSLLLLSTEPTFGVIRLARRDLTTGTASILWQRRALELGTTVHVARCIPGGRIALLAEKDRRTTYRTIRMRDGVALGTPIRVASDTSDLAIVDGILALASPRGLGPVQAYSDRVDTSSGPSFTFAGALTGRTLAYAFATSGSRDLSSGGLFVYRSSEDGLSQGYSDYFAPGAFDLVQSGDRLILLLTDGRVRVYNVAEPSRPRLAGQFYQNKGWIAFATPPDAKSFYALGNDGTLRAYRWDDRKGIVPASNAVPGPPTDWARMFAYPGGVAVGKDDGTLHLYRASGTTLAKAADVKVGTGPVFVLD